MIEEISQALGGIPHGVVYALLAFSVVVAVLQVVALVDLARRTRVAWDRKWVWVLIILLVSNGIGVALWFLLGRRVPQEDPDSQAAPQRPGADRTDRAVDVLYGGNER